MTVPKPTKTKKINFRFDNKVIKEVTNYFSNDVYLFAIITGMITSIAIGFSSYIIIAVIIVFIISPMTSADITPIQIVLPYTSPTLAFLFIITTIIVIVLGTISAMDTITLIKYKPKGSFMADEAQVHKF